MNLFELYAKLVLDTSDYENGVNRAESMGETLATSLERGMRNARKAQAAMDGLGDSQQEQGDRASQAASDVESLAEAERRQGNEADTATTQTEENSEALDDLGEEAEEAERRSVKLKKAHKGQGDEAEKAADKVNKLGEALRNGLTVGAKAVGAGIAAAASAVVMLTKSAVESYASYEQLKGGVETLFGTGGKSIEEYAKSANSTVEAVRAEYSALEQAQSAVMKNAADAYKNVGMSANDYMETVTSFAASLKEGLGGDTVAAAEKADRALRDMADNSNKMGTSMESIQNAYNGFAKQNYTMLDNLSNLGALVA